VVGDGLHDALDGPGRGVDALARERREHLLALEADARFLREEALRLELEEDLIEEGAEARLVVVGRDLDSDPLLDRESVGAGDDVGERERRLREERFFRLRLALEAEVGGVIEETIIDQKDLPSQLMTPTESRKIAPFPNIPPGRTS